MIDTCSCTSMRSCKLRSDAPVSYHAQTEALPFSVQVSTCTIPEEDCSLVTGVTAIWQEVCWCLCSVFGGIQYVCVCVCVCTYLLWLCLEPCT